MVPAGSQGSAAPRQVVIADDGNVDASTKHKHEEPLFGPVPPWAIIVAAGLALFILIVIVIVYSLIRRSNNRKRAKREAEREQQAKLATIMKAGPAPLRIPDVVMPPQSKFALTTPRAKQRSIKASEAAVSASLELSPPQASFKRRPTILKSQSVAFTVVSTEAPPTIKSMPRSDATILVTSYEETLLSDDHASSSGSLPSVTARSL